MNQMNQIRNTNQYETGLFSFSTWMKRLSTHRRVPSELMISESALTGVYAIVEMDSLRTSGEAMKREKYFKSIDGYLWLQKQGII